MTDEKEIHYCFVEKPIRFVFVRVKPHIISVDILAQDAVEDYRIHFPDVPIVLVSHGTTGTPIFHDPIGVGNRPEVDLEEIWFQHQPRLKVLIV